MIRKKIILGFLSIILLGGCASPTAMLGPAYTYTSTGSLTHAGLAFGSNEAITNYTGKTPYENLEIKGWPVQTWLRGQKIYEHNKFITQKNLGRYVSRDFCLL